MNKERKIIIDYREKKLIELLEKKLNFTTQNLKLGDIIFTIDDNIQLFIERKTYSDLYASVIDGRLHEQKNRMLSTVDKSNKILYLIEGSISQRLIPKKKIINGNIYNILLKYGIPIYNTINIEQTVDLLTDLGNRFLNNLKPFQIDNNTFEKIPLSIVKKKNEIIDPGICFHYQLCQIPNISTNKASIIVEKWGNINMFIQELNKIDNQLELLGNLKLKNGKKIGKKTAEKILFFLGLNS